MRSQDNLDKKLRDDSSIPFGLEWDSVSSGIYDKMESKKSRRRVFPFWILSTMGLIFLVATVSYLGLLKNDQTVAIVEENPEQEDLSTLENLVSNTHDETSIKFTDALVNDQSASSATKKVTLNNSIKKINKISNHKENNHSVDQRAATNEALYSSKKIIQNDPVESTSYSEKKKNTNFTNLNTLNDHLVPYLNIPSISAIVSHGIIQDFDPVRIDMMPASIDPLQPNETQKKSWSIAAVGSLVYWDENYSADVLLAKKSKEEKTITGYHVGLEGAYQINNNWSVFSGLDRSRLYTQYEGTFRTQDSVRLMNVVLLTEINPLLSNPVHHSGDTTVLRNFDRYIRYHNIIDRWSLPIGIRYHKNYGPIELTAGLGVQFGLYKTGQGITARGIKRLDYDSSNDIYKHGLDIALRPEIGIRYNVTNRIYTGLTLNYQQHLVNWSSEQSLRTTPRIFRSGISIGYRL